jgi:hypothetical protein
MTPMTYEARYAMFMCAVLRLPRWGQHLNVVLDFFIRCDPSHSRRMPPSYGRAPRDRGRPGTVVPHRGQKRACPRSCSQLVADAELTCARARLGVSRARPGPCSRRRLQS